MMAEAAKAQYWDALDSEQFERYERRQRFIDHFAAFVSDRQAAVLAVVAEQCRDHGHCWLSVGKLADAAFVTNATARRALHAARRLGLIEMQGDDIRIVSPEWQALLREKGRDPR
jgi:hypothetical protein